VRALVQRVSKASVTTSDRAAETGPGLMILLGVKHGDTEKDAAWLANKCAGLRIFEDDAGKMNLSVLDTGGEALVVSQFTLYGNAEKGKRPSFTGAARPEIANALYERFVAELRNAGVKKVATGVFQAMMRVTIVNEGPVTLMIESPSAGGSTTGPELAAPAGFGAAFYSGPPILLASQSPRRAEILAKAGVSFEIVKLDVDETPKENAAPRDVALDLAERKARAALDKHPGRVILTADTVVDAGGELLNKPANHADAKRMLARLSGRRHDVHTGVAVTHADGRIEAAVETTGVVFRDLTSAEIDVYVKSNEPMDKAGAYGIQGFGACLVDRVEGSYENVVGLPLALALSLLRNVAS